MNDKTKKNVQEIKVSVILPVFDVEGYIDACITSLMAQTLRNLEFIFVDDCGSDNSMNVVEEWAKNDDRVRILRNDHNLGSGPARNRGIEEARGEYLSFVDPDDYLSENFYELLYSRARETDAVIVKGIRIPVDKSNNKAVKDCTPKRMNRRISFALARNTPLYTEFFAEHQSAIYKREFLITHPNVRYGSSTNAQDTTFLLRLCLETEDIAIENRAVYYYVKRNNAATYGCSPNRSWGELDSLREKIDAILKYSLDEHAYKAFGGRISGYINNSYVAFRNAGNNSDEKNQYIDSLNEQVCRFPDVSLLYEDAPNLRAVCEYREILPSSRVKGHISFRECLEKWSDFLERYPEASSEYSKACAETIVKCQAYKILKTIHIMSPDEIASNRYISFDRIDKKRRLEVMRYTPLACAKFFLKLMERIAVVIL